MNKINCWTVAFFIEILFVVVGAFTQNHNSIIGAGFGLLAVTGLAYFVNSFV